MFSSPLPGFVLLALNAGFAFGRRQNNSLLQGGARVGIVGGVLLKKLSLLLCMAVAAGSVAYAGGGGENMLLVVNPNDEPSLRIANAYIAARHIPACNDLYLAPPATPGGLTPITITEAQFDSGYLVPIYNAIASRGLINQIDYIGTLGQSQAVNIYTSYSLNDCLAQLTQFHNGMGVSGIVYRPSEILQGPNFGRNSNVFDYTPGANAAIHHTQSLVNLSGTLPTPNVQWYMSGMIGYAGQYGQLPSQVIQGLRRSVAGDGAKPAGTVYFEDSGDAYRIPPQKTYWPSVQSYMTAHRISWVQESGVTPVNRQNVLGVAIGAANFTAPNGSNYVAGSWADSLTSWGGVYGSNPQTQAAMMLQAGCAGSAGTVNEPTNGMGRFPLCGIWVFMHDGSTLGEAFYKSVNTPDMIMFQGDLLSQAYADIPQVSTSVPLNSSTVSGIVSVSASASLTNPLTATGIASLSLFVDGMNTGLTVSGSAGTFNLNTATLTDGQHELRVVAYNNSLAASEGCAILNVAVNNLGQSVRLGGASSYNIGWNQTLAIPVSVTQGSGPAITGVQLQSYGRVVGAISGTTGSLSVSGTQLAFDANLLTPVAILSSGSQVQGTPITVIRQNRPFPGTVPTPVGKQNHGFDFYYYPGAGGNTLATTNFSGTAAYVGHADAATIGFTDGVDPNIPSALKSNNAGLAVAIKGLFTVPAYGEYGFSAIYGGWTSGAILVDGVPLNSFDCWNGSSYDASGGADSGCSVYLQPGEHSVTVQLVQATASSNSNFSLYYRSPQQGGPNNTIKGGQQYYEPPQTSYFALSPFFYTVLK